MQVKKIISKHSFWFLLSMLSALSVYAGESFAAQLNLSWTDNSNNETGFKIDRKTGATGTYAQIASLGANVSAYADTTVTAGTNYCYRVYAFNTAGNSTYTADVCGTAPIPTFTLAVTKAGTGGGSLTSSPAGINCTTSCSGTFNSGTVVALTAAPAAGSAFAGWTGTGCGTTGSVTLSANRTCTATFNLQTFALVVTKAGTGSGTMTSSPAGINCTTNCSGTFNSGTVVTVTAAPAAGSVFAAWVGTGCAATTATVAVTMNANLNCTATFNLQPVSTFTLTSAKAGTGSGTVTSNPAGINCGSTCTESYTSGATVALTASPAADSKFVSWAGTGCNATTAIINVGMSVIRSCTATFDSQEKDMPLMTQIGVFRPSTGEWFLDSNGNGFFDGCIVDTCRTNYGSNAMVPVVGDWQGSGRTSIGVFEPETGTWHLDNGNGEWDDCASDGDICITTNGSSGSLPVIKELSSETLVVGIFQTVYGTKVNGQGVWNFDLNGDGNVDQCSIDQCIDFGMGGDLPIIGDWNGTGRQEIGVFRPQSRQFYLDLNGNGKWDGSAVDRVTGAFGYSTDLPIVGDWDGTGKIRIGVYRPSTQEWFLDMNGNSKWEGSPTDARLGPFGQAGDLPVVGKW